MDVYMVCLFVCLLASSVGRFDFSRFHFCSVSHNILTGAGVNLCSWETKRHAVIASAVVDTITLASR